MADIGPVSPESLGYTLLDRDIPPELVDSVLDQQRQQDLFLRYSLMEWQLMQQKPNLRHYLAVTSFEVAPDDPILRERVVSALLGMFALLEEAVTNEKLEAVYTAANPETGNDPETS